MNGHPLPREELLAALNNSAKSITVIAAELGITVRAAMIYRSTAGVSPVFRNDDGEPFIALSDIPRIQAAAEKYGPLREKRVDLTEPLPEEPSAFNALCDKAGKMAQGIYE